MSVITPLLLIGILLLTAAGVVALYFAWRNAGEGFEDETGFHPLPSEPADHPDLADLPSSPIGISPSPRG